MIKVVYETISSLFSTFSKRYLIYSFLIFGISVIAAFFDLLSILLLGKVILLLNNQEIVLFKNISFLSNISSKYFILLFIIIALLAGLSKIIYSYLSTIYAAKCGAILAEKVYSITLRQRYQEFIQSNLSDTLALINRQLDNTVAVINNLFLFAAYLTTCIFMLIVVVTVIPIKLFFILLLVPTIYILISKISRKRILYISNATSDLVHNQMQFARESLDMKKDITLNKKFKLFEKEFYSNEIKRRLLEAEVMFRSTLPRNILEMVIIISLVFLVTVFSSSENDLLISTILSLGLATQKLLPSFQGIYSIAVVINAYSDSVKRITNYINNTITIKFNNDTNPIGSFKELKINNLVYKYPGTNKKVFKSLSTSINKGEFIAIKGLSGVGKSTLIDLLIGLLPDNSNSLKINATKINNCLNSWNQQIQYVGQSVFLVDNSIYQNLILGNKMIFDNDYLNLILQKTGLKNVFKKFDITIQDRVGENGNLISRGQRQRIGIARALLRSPNVIFLDEATNGLDFKSERQIYQDLRDFKDLTLIAITHSNSLDQCFDKIIELN